MKRTASYIVKFRYLLAAVFAVLIVMSVFSYSWVNTEDDITEYLPDSTEAKTGLTIMHDEFITYATADVMVKNVTLDDAEKIGDMLGKIDGVQSVTFDNTEDHYKDRNALYNVRFNGTSEDEEAVSAMEQVKKSLASYNFYVDSDSFSNLNQIMITEMTGVLVIVIFVVIGVLLFTSSTYAEILILLLTFIVAAVVNMGTNFILGTISFISYTVAIVLQLALSVDYAIILCNRYKEEHLTKPVKEAVESALTHAIPEILASSLTTIAGLAAMTFMQFRLGADMGVCLIKAIIVSLFTVFFFMPFLLVQMGDLMDRTKHRNFVPKISFAGKFAYATRYIIPPLFVLMMVFAFSSYRNVNFAYTEEIVKAVHQNEEDVAVEEIQNVFGKNNMLAILVPAGDYEKEEAFVSDLEKCDEINSVLGLANVEAIGGYTLGSCINSNDFAEIAGIDETTSKAIFAYYASETDEYRQAAENIDDYKVPIVDLFLMIHDMEDSGLVEISEDQINLINDLYSQLKMAEDQLQGDDYSRIIAYVDLPVQSDETFKFIASVHELADKYYGSDNVYITGDSVSARDFYDTYGRDNLIVSIMSIVFVLVILLLTFRSFGMPILLILVIQGSIWLNFAIAKWTGNYVHFMCTLIVTAIQMGANIDYAIVISSRYRGLRSENIPKKKAITETLNISFPTVITSGAMMVVAGLLVGQKVSEIVIAGMGHYVGIGTIISLVFVNFVLPQMLLIGDGFVNATTIKLPKRIWNTQKLIKTAASCICIAAIVAGIAGAGYAVKNGKYDLSENESNLEYVYELKEIASDIENNSDANDALRYDYAEQTVTVSVGNEKLAEGKAQIEQGEAELAQGKLDYEDGLENYKAGQIKLSEAKEQYAEGEQKLQEIETLYNALLPLYEKYEDLQNSYDNAVSKGNTLLAASLEIPLGAAKMAFETELAGSGYSITDIITAYQEGERQLVEGSTQIADGEQELEAGKIALDEGAVSIASGESELASAKQEYAEGEKTVEDNYNELQKTLDKLDDCLAKKNKLGEGIDVLVGNGEIKDKIERDASDIEICNVAEEYYNEHKDAVKKSMIRDVLICLAVAAAGAAGIILIRKKKS